MEEQLPVPGPAETFDESDRACLALYGGVVESIARSFGSSCEVVLHSLEDVGRSVVKIENSGVTGRSVGAPMTDFGLQVLGIAEAGGDDVVGPYFTKSGQHTLRSVTVVLRNFSGKPIGCLCINMDLSAPFVDIARDLLPPPFAGSAAKTSAASQPATDSIEHFASSPKDLIRQTLLSVPLPSGTDRTRGAVEELYGKGIFRIKGSVEMAAEELDVSKHTIYYYLRELRGKEDIPPLP